MGKIDFTKRELEAVIIWGATVRTHRQQNGQSFDGEDAILLKKLGDVRNRKGYRRWH
jgi:hypothetical protein